MRLPLTVKALAQYITKYCTFFKMKSTCCKMKRKGKRLKLGGLGANAEDKNEIVLHHTFHLWQVMQGNNPYLQFL